MGTGTNLVRLRERRGGAEDAGHGEGPRAMRGSGAAPHEAKAPAHGDEADAALVAGGREADELPGDEAERARGGRAGLLRSSAHHLACADVAEEHASRAEKRQPRRLWASRKAWHPDADAAAAASPRGEVVGEARSGTARRVAASIRGEVAGASTARRAVAILREHLRGEVAGSSTPGRAVESLREHLRG